MSVTQPSPSGAHIFHARPGQVAYGYPIGMLCAQWNIPFLPGDLNNAGTFDFPVRYLEVDISGAAVLRGEGKRFLPVMIDGARRLEAEGVRALTGNCGFMAAYQKEVADAVDIPVFLSSLIQIPMLTTMLGSRKQLAVLTANSLAITSGLLNDAGVSYPSQLIVWGLESAPHFRDVILEERGTLNVDVMRTEVIASSRALLAAHPDVGAILLECSDLPVYAADISAATGLPIFEWAAYIDFVHRAVVPRRFHGFY